MGRLGLPSRVPTWRKAGRKTCAPSLRGNLPSAPVAAAWSHCPACGVVAVGMFHAQGAFGPWSALCPEWLRPVAVTWGPIRPLPAAETGAGRRAELWSCSGAGRSAIPGRGHVRAGVWGTQRSRPLEKRGREAWELAPESAA